MLVVGGGIQGPVILVMHFWFDLTAGQAAVMYLLLLGALAIGLAIGLGTSDEIRCVVAWGRGDANNPVETWRAGLRAAPTATFRGSVVVAALDLVIAAPTLQRIAHLDLWAFVGVVLSVVVSTYAAAIVIAVGFQLLLRPLLEELAPLLPPDVDAPARLWGLRGRLQSGVAAACFLAATASGAAGTLGTSIQDRFALVTVSACLLAVYFTMLFSWGLIDPALDPMRDLAQGIERVRNGNLSEPLVVTTPDELGDLVRAFDQMQRGLREREALHAAFGSYVDPILAERLLASGSPLFKGEEVVVSVLFADVRGFTTFSETVTPRAAVSRLNSLFDIVVPVLQRHGGHANHYLGDGVLAVFGAPSPMENHADAAVAAALEMQAGVLKTFGDSLRLGIGINTGAVIAGTVGGGGRLEFTVIGDTVNVAARVEQLTKETGDQILMTEATLAALTSPVASRDRGPFAVRGKAKVISLHALEEQG